MSRPRDLVQGTLDLLALRVIALEPMHGWAIGQRIRQMSNDALRGAERAVPRPPLTRVLVTAQKAKASAVCVNAEGARPLHQEPWPRTACRRSSLTVCASRARRA
jgi:hypothetical protein